MTLFDLLMRFEHRFLIFPKECFLWWSCAETGADNASIAACLLASSVCDEGVSASSLIALLGFFQSVFF